MKSTIFFVDSVNGIRHYFSFAHIVYVKKENDNIIVYFSENWTFVFNGEVADRILEQWIEYCQQSQGTPIDF